MPWGSTWKVRPVKEGKDGGSNVQSVSQGPHGRLVRRVPEDKETSAWSHWRCRQETARATARGRSGKELGSEDLHVP
jgi:hypothetical protein